MPRHPLLAWLLVGALPVAALACGDGGQASGHEVVVLAAASLTDAFAELGEVFEQEHGVPVTFAFGASSSLREQILEGAPADVFAAAAPGPVADLADAGIAHDVTTFASNRLQVAVPAGNPARVERVEDLADTDLLVGICAPEVPCGMVARRVLRDVGVDLAPDTEEPDVRALLTKLAAGELDAGLVYATDVLASGGEVEGIDVPAGVDASTSYPVALVGDDPPGAAEDFVDLLRGPEGQRVLRAHGFGAP